MAIGLPYALLLGLLAGVFEALPMIGPLLGMLPALLIALATMPAQAVWVVVAATVIQQIENNVLVPRVMGRTVGINPIISILAIAAFTLLFGVAGALFAIPMAAVLQLLITRVLSPVTFRRTRFGIGHVTRCSGHAAHERTGTG